MGWLLSAGQVGAADAAPMRIVSTHAYPGWSLGASNAHGRADPNVWQDVLAGLTDHNADKPKKEEDHDEY